jgi:hypothetical protein
MPRAFQSVTSSSERLAVTGARPAPVKHIAVRRWRWRDGPCTAQPSMTFATGEIATSPMPEVCLKPCSGVNGCFGLTESKDSTSQIPALLFAFSLPSPLFCPIPKRPLVDPNQVSSLHIYVIAIHCDASAKTRLLPRAVLFFAFRLISGAGCFPPALLTFHTFCSNLVV